MPPIKEEHRQGSKKKSKPANRVLQTFGDNLVLYRKKANLTQEELATAIGLSRVQITNIEAGHNATTIVHLLCICAVLKVSPTDLLPPVPHVTLKKTLISTRVIEKNAIEAKFKW
jgi:transcriptional regulator with XRE-family HTH domain